MIPIVQNGDAVLRKKAKEVPEKEITRPKIAAILGRMKEALDSQEDGVAIAAPQIGEAVRIFVVSEKVFHLPEEHAKRRAASKAQEEEAWKSYGHLVFVNPVITKLSKKKVLLEEGCLSVRGLFGKIERATKATVRALDEHGTPFTRGASGLLAQVFQHEVDHLDGLLFVDKAAEVRELPLSEKESRTTNQNHESR